MYQSIPKRVYTQQESAMPKFPISQQFLNEKQGYHSISKTPNIPNIPKTPNIAKIPKIPKTPKIPKLLNELQTDDLLLIGLLILLLSEEGDHELLVLAVAFLLFF